MYGLLKKRLLLLGQLLFAILAVQHEACLLGGMLNSADLAKHGPFHVNLQFQI